MPGKTVILHVGLPKTGTTSIQDFLAERADVLAASGILFPTVAREIREVERQRGIGFGWHFSLMKYVSGQRAAMRAGEWERWIETFAAFREPDGPSTLVLSQEGLAGARHRAGLDDLLAQLPSDDLDIVIVVRSAEIWLTSLYEQLVRSRKQGAMTPDAFKPALHYADHGFEGQIHRIAKQIPRGRLRLLSYETLTGGDGLLVNFAGAIGLPALVSASRRSDANASLPQPMVALLRACNAAGAEQADFIAIRSALAALHRAAGVPSPRASVFAPDLQRRILARYEADRVFFSQAYALDLPAAAPLPPASNETLRIPSDVLDALFTRLTGPQQAIVHAAAQSAMS